MYRSKKKNVIKKIIKTKCPKCGDFVEKSEYFIGEITIFDKIFKDRRNKVEQHLFSCHNCGTTFVILEDKD